MNSLLTAFNKSPLFYQVLAYGLVGVTHNLFTFVLFLLLTWKWLDPKIAVTLLYPVGALIGYFGHAKLSFSFSGAHLMGLHRFFIAHVVGYLTNILILFVFVDLLGYPHFLIQAIAIFAVAGVLFFLFRYYVFPQRASG